MGRADRARRERPSRRLSFRPRAAAGAASLPCFLFRMARAAGRLAPVAALLLAGAVSLAAPASGGELVSNFGRGSGGTSHRGFDQAQAFTTGSHAAGYVLTGVDIELSDIATWASFSVGIWSSDEEADPGADSNARHEPHVHLGTLSGPAALAEGANAFTASGIELEASTTYLVMIDIDDVRSAGAFSIHNTRSDAQDPGGAPGWSIGDTTTFLGRSGTVVWSFSGDSSLKIRVNGTAKPAAPTLSADATLGALAVSDGTNDVTLSPAFASGTYDYTAAVANAVSQVTVTPTTTDSGATVAYTKGDGTAITGTVDLEVGETVINVNVTAENRSDTQTYKVTVTRAAPILSDDATLGALVVNDGTNDVTLDPGFAPDEYTYAASVAHALDRVTLVPATSDANAAVAYEDGRGKTLADRDRVTPGHQVDLEVGGNVIKVTVTAADGRARQTYTVTVTRAAATETRGVPRHSHDTTAPSFSSASVNGATLVITFDETLAAASSLANTAFTVKKTSSGTEETVTLGSTAPSIDGATVTLTLETAAASTDTDVKVSYAVPSMDSNNRLEDAEGNEVASFTDQPVTNITGAVPVTIASNHDEIGAGLEDLVFTLTRRGATTDALDATVTLAQDEDWLLGPADNALCPDRLGPSGTVVTFPAGDAETMLTLEALCFSLEPDTAGKLTATVGGAGIQGGSKTVEIVSTSEPPITISFDKSEYTFSEDRVNPNDPWKQVNIYVDATLHADYPRAPSADDLYILIQSLSGLGTADPNLSLGDYTPISHQEYLEEGEFVHDGTAFVARKPVATTLRDDEIYEGPEYFKFELKGGPGLRHGMMLFTNPDGTTCAAWSCSPDPTYRVTITDPSDRPDLSLSAVPAAIPEADDTLTPDVVENASVVTVSIANGEIAPGRSLTLMFEGTAVQGTDYTVDTADADEAEDGLQVVLEAQATEVEVTVTAADNTDVDGPRTVEVSGWLFGEQFGAATITINDNDRATNEAPLFGDGAQTQRSVVETAPPGTAIGAPVVATDGDGDSLRYILEGTDAASFDIDGMKGQLLTRAGVDLDYETKNSYAVTVTANDGFRGFASIDVTVLLTDALEPPEAPDAPSVEADRGSVTSLQVTWDEPGNAGPRIDHYDLQYRVEGSVGWTEGPQDVVARSATLLNLTRGTIYEVQVRATNEEGDGAWSASGRGAPGLYPTLDSLTVTHWGKGSNNEARPVIAHGTPYALSPAFDPDIYEYDVVVEAGYVTVTATSGDPDAEVEYLFEAGRTSATGRVTPLLRYGRNGRNVFRVSVTPPGGVARTYTLNVRRVSLLQLAEGENFVNSVWRLESGGADVNKNGQSVAQGFTSGWRRTGYALTQIMLKPKGAPRNPYEVMGQIEASIWSADSNGNPGEKLFDLEVTRGLGDRGHFLVGPPAPEALQRYTRYFLVVESKDGNFKVGKAPNRAEVSHVDGWDIADAFHISTDDGQTWARQSGEESIALSIWGIRQPLERPGTAQQEEATALTAESTAVPASHDGMNAFTVDIVFNETPHGEGGEMTDAALQSLLTVTGGTKSVSTVNDNGAHRRVTVTPDGTDAVTIALFGSAGCGEADSICSASGGLFTEPLLLLVPGPEAPIEPKTPVVTPLTAEFTDVPEEHDGQDFFEMHLGFSEAIFTGDESFDKNKAVREALDVRGGTVGKPPRASGHRDSFDKWRLKVWPSGDGLVTVSLAPTPDCAAEGAICSLGGGRLAKSVSVEIPGPAQFRVADATVEEGPGAVLAFDVTLDRARHEATSVDYRTVNGSAEAGTDYVAASGTLVFEAGDILETVEVTALDDSHDEGNETMTLRLSNAQGAKIADGEAVGTIENSDLMPQAWLARFGRTVAEQVLEAVEARMRAGPRAGMELTLAGQRFGGAAEALAEAGDEAPVEGLASWLEGAACRDAGADCPAAGSSRAITPRELLTGSAFALTGGTAEGGFATLWGRGAFSRFDGREGALTLDGDVTSLMLGTDWARENWSAGLIVSHARGEGGYRGPSSGEVASTLTGLYPWGRYAMTDRVTVWGVAGYGAGTLALTPEGEEALETDMDLMMAAAGLRGVVAEAPAAGGPELSVKTDALAVRTSSDAVTAAAGGNLEAATAQATRLRLGLEGTWRSLVIGTGTLIPRLELAARHDGGDAETGFGLDVGAGVAWSDPQSGVHAEASGRGLVTHENSGFGQRGFAGRLGWDPRPSTERGPSLTLTQTMGLAASGGAEALLGRRTLEDLSANDDGDELASRRFEMRLGYGFAAFDDRFTAMPQAGLAWSESIRETVLAWRLAEERRSGFVFGLDVEGALSEPVDGGGEPAHRLGFGLGWQLEGAPAGAFELRLYGAWLEGANDNRGTENRLGLSMTVRW